MPAGPPTGKTPPMTDSPSTLDWPLNVGGETVPLRHATPRQLRLAAILADEDKAADLRDLGEAFRHIASHLDEGQSAESLGDDRLEALIWESVRTVG